MVTDDVDGPVRSRNFGAVPVRNAYFNQDNQE